MRILNKWFRKKPTQRIVQVGDKYVPQILKDGVWFAIDGTHTWTTYWRDYCLFDSLDIAKERISTYLGGNVVWDDIQEDKDTVDYKEKYLELKSVHETLLRSISKGEDNAK